MRPPAAVGSVIRRVVRQRAMPRAWAASFSVAGTSVSTSWAVRATIGSMMIASATEPAKPLWCPWASTIRPKTKIPVMIVGTPFSTSSDEAKRVGDSRRGEFGRVDRDQESDRDRHQPPRSRP